VITGTNVTLRAPCAEDADVLYLISSELTTWDQRTPEAPRPLTREAFDARFQKQLSEGGVEFVIEVDGRPVGRIGLFGEDPLARHAEVGVGLVAEARGRGYGTEAMRMMCEFAFFRRNLRRLVLEVLASNAAAIASYRKVGFVEEGVRREHAWVSGHYEDMIEMGLLRSEFAG
jgi:RimJ/RimL family protein N-acetyltransferase